LNVRIGFSTSDAWYSGIIRRFTRSPVSHTFLLVEVAGHSIVLEEGPDGFRARTIENFTRGNRIVTLITPLHPVERGVEEAITWLGQRYDYFGVLGMAAVLVYRWFGKKRRNPLASSRSMFCSEANTRILQVSGYPGADKLDPESTSPADLLEFLTQ
jgi:hypothetical protein